MKRLVGVVLAIHVWCLSDLKNCPDWILAELACLHNMLDSSSSCERNLKVFATRHEIASDGCLDTRYARMCSTRLKRWGRGVVVPDFHREMQ